MNINVIHGPLSFNGTAQVGYQLTEDTRSAFCRADRDIPLPLRDFLLGIERSLQEVGFLDADFRLTHRLEEAPSESGKRVILIQTVNDVGQVHTIGAVRTEISEERIIELWNTWREETPEDFSDSDSEFIDWLVLNHGAVSVDASIALIDIG